MNRKFVYTIVGVLLALSLIGCTPRAPKVEPEKKTIMVAAAASLRNCMEGDLKTMFEAKHSNVEVTFTFDSSGKLQTQIEEGADVDVFFSAAKKQMKALDEKGMIDSDSVVDLLENKIVLIVPKGSKAGIASFEDIGKAKVIAIGDPQSVPAGQYAKEAFTNLDLWDAVSAKASFGSNVTEVLNWVAEGSADAGVVYATDAATTDKVQVVAEAPKDTVSKVVYPVGIVKASTKKDAAKLFIDFLKSPDALKVFEKYGFSPNL